MGLGVLLVLFFVIICGFKFMMYFCDELRGDNIEKNNGIGLFLGGVEIKFEMLVD